MQTVRVWLVRYAIATGVTVLLWVGSTWLTALAGWSILYRLGLYGTTALWLIAIAVVGGVVVAHGWQLFTQQRRRPLPRHAYISQMVLLGVVLALLGGGLGSALWRQSNPPIDPEARSFDDFPVIFEVLATGDRAQVEKLIAVGADVNARGFANTTPLIDAGLAGQWAVVDTLLASGADPAQIDDRGISLPYLVHEARNGPNTTTVAALERVYAALVTAEIMWMGSYKPSDILELQANGAWPPQTETEE